MGSSRAETNIGCFGAFEPLFHIPIIGNIPLSTRYRDHSDRVDATSVGLLGAIGAPSATDLGGLPSRSVLLALFNYLRGGVFDFGTRTQSAPRLSKYTARSSPGEACVATETPTVTTSPIAIPNRVKSQPQSVSGTAVNTLRR